MHKCKLIFCICLAIHIFNVKAETCVSDTLEYLKQFEIPIFEFELENNEFPKADIIFPPDGCWGRTITNNEYIKGSLKITQKGETVYYSEQYNKENKTGIRLKRRGNTSNYVGALKTGYKIKLSSKEDLFFREDKNYKDKDWVLIGTPMAANNLHNIIGNEIGRLCGSEWQPYCSFINLFINKRYFGLYLLSEAVSKGENRCNIENSGFVIENDPYFWKPGEVYFKTKHSLPALGFTFKEPDIEDHPEVIKPIEEYINVFEDALYEGGDITAYIDFRSFASWLIAHDILGTNDGAGSNIFLLKRTLNPDNIYESKLSMGPLWDFDLIFGVNEEEWSQIHNAPFFYYPKLFLNRDFVITFKNTWNEIKESLYENVNKYLTNLGMLYPDLNEVRKFESECGLSNYVSLNDNKEQIINWIGKRIEILDAKINDIAIPTSGIECLQNEPHFLVQCNQGVVTVSNIDRNSNVYVFDLSGKELMHCLLVDSCFVWSMTADTVIITISSNCITKSFKVRKK